MKNKRFLFKIIITILLLGIAAFTISGCAWQEETKYENYAKSGVVKDYIKQKYHFDSKITDVKFNFSYDLDYPELSDTVTVNCKKGNTKFCVLVDGEQKKVLGDDYQLNILKKDIHSALKKELPKLNFKEEVGEDASITYDGLCVLPKDVYYKGDLNKIFNDDKFDINIKYYASDKGIDSDEYIKKFIAVAKKVCIGTNTTFSMNIIYDKKLKNFEVDGSGSEDQECTHSYAYYCLDDDTRQPNYEIKSFNFIKLNDLIEVCVPDTECSKDDFTIEEQTPDLYKNCSEYSKFNYKTNFYKITYKKDSKARILVRIKDNKNYREYDCIVDTNSLGMASLYNIKNKTDKGVIYYNTTEFIDNGYAVAIAENKFYKANPDPEWQNHNK